MLELVYRRLQFFDGGLNNIDSMPLIASARNKVPPTKIMPEAGDLFATYEKEYKTLYETISKNISSLKTSDQKKLLTNQIQRELEEADEILGQLEMELFALPPQQRNQNTITLRSYKESLKKLKRDMTNNAASERDQLLGNSVTVDMPSDQGQRSRLLQGTDRLENASRRLDDAHRMALQTEEIGISTLGDLHRQGQQIRGFGDRLGEADSWIAKSQGLLKSMQRKLAANKLLMWGIIALLILLILAIIVAKFT